MMYDDLLGAAALATVGAVLTAAVWAGASDWSSPAPAPAVATAPAGVATAGAAPGPMPVYQLPRVVVEGTVSRDGDLLAADLPAAPARADVR